MADRIPEDPKFLSISLAAQILGVSQETVRRWDKAGIVRSIRSNNNTRYFLRDDIERLTRLKPLSISEAAETLGVSTTTLRRLEKRGTLMPERNGHGERVYPRPLLEEFSKKPLPTVKTDLAEQPNFTPLNDADVAFSLGRLFRRAIVVLAIPTLLIILLLTTLFLFNPRETARYLGYKKSMAKSTNEQRPLWSRLLQPFSAVSLEIIKVIDKEKYETLREVLVPPIGDVNNIFTIDDSGNIVPYRAIRFPKSVYLKISDKGLIKNLNADYIRGKVPGSGFGNLVVFGEDNTVFALRITAENINDGAVIGGFGGAILDSSITDSDISPDTFDFTELEDSLELDSETRIALGTNNFIFNLNETGDFIIQDAGITVFTFTDTGALTQTGSGQVTFSGNVDATGGLDVSGANFTVGGTNFIVDVSNGNITTAGDLAVNGDDITSDGNLTINATGYTRIGDTATPGLATGDDDLYVEGDLEVDGLIFADGGITASDLSCIDCLDFTDFEDILDLDTSTELNFGAFNFNFDLDSTGDFTISDGGTPFVTFSDDGATTFTNSLTFTGAGNHDITASSGTLRLGAYTTTGAITLGSGLDILATATAGTDIGTSSTRLDTIYAVTVDATNIAGTLTGGNTTAAIFTLNSDNATADTEDSSIGFERGTIAPNAFLTWDSTNDEFDLNAGLHISDSISPVSSVLLALDATGAGTTADGLLISQTSSGTITDAIDVSDETITNAINIGTNFLVASGDSINDFTGNGALVVSSNALQLDATVSGDALSATTSSGSGLEILSSGLTLLQGCATDEVLKWNETTDVWACGNSSLQSAYNSGNTITTTTGRDIEITLADVATDTTFEITQAGTADILRVNDDGTFTDTTPFVIDASGNVGVGTTSPVAKLDIQGPMGFVPGVRIKPTTGTTFAYQLFENDGGNFQIGIENSTGDGLLANGLAYAGVINRMGNNPLQFGTNDLSRMAITGTGNVGIGTTGPDRKLDVLDASSPQLRLTQADGAVYGEFQIDSSGNLTVTTTGSTTSFLDNLSVTGHILPGTDDTYDLGSDTLRWKDLYVGPGSIKVGGSGDQSTISYTTASDLLTFQNSADSATGFQFLDADGGTPILNVDTTNERVGIGTAAPASTLHVAGITTVNDDILPNAAASASSRTLTVVDSTNTVGKFNSIAVPSDGNAIISYHYETGDDLKVAKCGNTSCSSGNTITTVDSTNNVGKGSSIAIPSDGLPVISYYYETGGDLRMIKCGNSTCSSGNTTTTVDSGNVIPSNNTAIAIGSDGFPVIAYNTNSSGPYLTVVKCGNSTCSSGNTTTDVLTGTRRSEWVSIAIGTDNNPVIANYHAGNGSGTVDLEVVKCGNTSCSSGNTTTTVDSSGDVGKYNSIIVPSDGLPIISYLYATSADLKVIKCGNASCSSGNTTTTVDSASSVSGYTSITMGGDSLPVISYQAEGGGGMRVAKCGNTSCSSGNTLTTIDAESNGQHTSIAISGDGYPIISYFYATNADLKVAYCVSHDCVATAGVAGGSNLGSVSAFFNTVYTGNTNTGLTGTVTNNGICHSGGGSNSSLALTDRRDLVVCNGTASDIAEWYETKGTEPGDIVVTTNETFTYESRKVDARTGIVSEEKETHTVSVLERSSRPYQSNTLGIISTSPHQTFGKAIMEGATDAEPVALIGRVPVKVSAVNGAISPGDHITTSDIPGVGMKATEPGKTIGTALDSYDSQDVGKIMIFVNPSWFSEEAYLNESGDLMVNGKPVYLTEDGELAGDEEREGEEAGEVPPRTRLSLKDLLTRVLKLEKQHASMEAKLQKEEETATDEAVLSAQVNLASAEALLDEKEATLSALTVTGKTNLYDLGVVGNLNVGTIFIDGLTASLDSLGTPLQIQATKTADISFLSDLIVFDKEGNVKIKEGRIHGNDSFRGKATIKQGQTEIRVEQSWPGKPSSLTLTPTYKTTVWFEDLSSSGFTIKVDSAPSSDQEVHWLAVW